MRMVWEMHDNIIRQYNKKLKVVIQTDLFANSDFKECVIQKIATWYEYPEK